jgi:short-chain fatty acids transporter
LLTFSMQVMFTLVSGHIVALAPSVQRGLARIALLARSPGQAIILVTLVGMAASYINWGFGLIAAALFARAVASNVKGVHYPLLVASAYSGNVIWHAGLSGSIPLKLASPDDPTLAAIMGGEIVPLSATIFTPHTMLLVLVVVVTVASVNYLMQPPPEQRIELSTSNEITTPAPSLQISSLTPAQQLEHSQWPALALGLLAGFYLSRQLWLGSGFGLNSMNLAFLTAGILLHRTPAAYLKALNESISCGAGILLQYPLYAGIMGMMVSSGLAASLSNWFVSLSSTETFPVWTFFSAGLVNLFVPSGGGQWALQAPIVIPAAAQLNVPLAEAAMAVAWGDAWTNLIQPFWTIPLLAVARLSLRDVMGYLIIAMLASGTVISAALYLG